jgi:hypothetical protein
MAVSWRITASLGCILLAGCLGVSPTPGSDQTSTPAQDTPVSEIERDPTAQAVEISGWVRDGSGPVSGAIVRVQTTDRFATTGDDGRFTLEVDQARGGGQNLTAWAHGYFCAGPVLAYPGDLSVEFVLQAHADSDNPDYEWLPSLFHPGEGESQGCAECHSNQFTNLNFTLPVDEWLLDAHARSAINPRFLTMYYGVDLQGNQSPVTRRAVNKDYGSFPIGPDLSRPYYGPGYKLDFPETAGNCAACHLPAAAVNNPYGIDPGSVSGLGLEGTPCDFCHKVWDIQVVSSTRLPPPNMPGVLSMAFRRPEEGHQFFAGPFDDVAPGEDTYSPIQTESVFCASCHYGVFWDTVIYNSYGEWLESSYSDPESGQTCQDCHMPPLGATQFATTKAGGLLRDPDEIFSHRMFGASDVEFMQNALSISTTAKLRDGTVLVEVKLLNDKAGHKIPTDSPLRQLLLVVQATNPDGTHLDQINGTTIPDWGGEGDPGEGNYGGLPGQAYALILEELWTGISPSGAYWNPVRVVSDNRLIPFKAENPRFEFDASDSNSVEVSIQLIYRRAYKTLMDQKGWTDEDIILYSQNYQLVE